MKNSCLPLDISTYVLPETPIGAAEDAGSMAGEKSPARKAPATPAIDKTARTPTKRYVLEK